MTDFDPFDLPRHREGGRTYSFGSLALDRALALERLDLRSPWKDLESLRRVVRAAGAPPPMRHETDALAYLAAVPHYGSGPYAVCEGHAGHADRIAIVDLSHVKVERLPEPEPVEYEFEAWIGVDPSGRMWGPYGGAWPAKRLRPEERPDAVRPTCGLWLNGARAPDPRLEYDL